MSRKESTIENRVYLFRSLARSWIAANPGAFGADDPRARARAVSALADLAYVACVVADTEKLDPAEVAEQVRAATNATSSRASS